MFESTCVISSPSYAKLYFLEK